MRPCIVPDSPPLLPAKKDTEPASILLENAWHNSYAQTRAILLLLLGPAQLVRNDRSTQSTIALCPRIAVFPTRIALYKAFRSPYRPALSNMYEYPASAPLLDCVTD